MMFGFKLKKSDSVSDNTKQVKFSDPLTTQDIEDLFNSEMVDECTVENTGLSDDTEPVHQQSETSDSIRKTQREKGKQRSTPLIASEEEEIDSARQREANSLKKGKSKENPSKGKTLKRKIDTSDMTSTTTQDPSTSPSTLKQSKSFIQVCLQYLTGILVTEWPLLQEVWEVQLMSWLEEETPQHFEEILELMSQLIDKMRSSDQTKSLMYCLSHQINSSWRNVMPMDMTETLIDFFTRFRTAKVSYQSQPGISTNKSTHLPVTVSQALITSTASTSAIGTEAHVVAEEQNPGEPIPSSPAVRTQSRGWTIKASATSSFITWVDTGYQYTVKSPRNTGDYVVKTEIYSKPQITGLPPQEWWKYPLHRSKVELKNGSPLVRHLKTYTEALENWWVDKQSGAPKEENLIQEMVARRPPPEKKQHWGSVNNSGPTF